ncbi:hypothetical protein [uncultured Treponema sp.]|uniref:hypothetical protein n=1 Tax=uncultured Treponema sp. TaxID=162155 RepID=UPI0025EF4D57|nr:hypothetical protein [uncultured Treponema sp.]
MRKIIAFLLSALLTASLFAQTTVAEKKLGKTLEKNKEASAVFVSEIDLSGMKVSENGTITIPLFAKNKISVVSGMDMTNIKERVAYTKKSKLATTFETKDLDSKTYAITKIDGIETVAQYKERFIEEQKAEARKNLTKMPVQVVNQEAINLSGSETAWLPGQIQDKLKSNLQEFLGMKTVVDSKSESALKKIQAESESTARDESTAIEFGKITTAKFAFFTKVRKTDKGYTISADFTDLTTGEQMASVISKEYSASEYLYGSTGAVDEITLSLGNKLGLKISDLNKNLLSSGSASFSVDEQLALARQNEEQFKKLMAQYDADLTKLSMSNDLSAIENKRKIEAEKALLVEKQNSEKKRQEELRAQKSRAEADAKLEAERSIALKTQRDQMAKEAAAKAAEVRKLKMEKQGVLGQINVIESKKKALVEIRQGVEERHLELFSQLEKDRESEEQRIRNKSYSTVELGSDGNPTEAAKTRRENQVIQSYKDLTNKFFADCDAVKTSTSTQESALLTEIRNDQKSLTKTRTVSSMGDELKVSFGTYEGSKNGWNAYLSLYSDGVLLYTDSFIVGYEALSGKKAPDMATELRDSVIEEYTNNVDMYNSLLTRGDPILYFEIDYTVKAEGDDKPSEYKFNFDKIRAINTVSGKTVQTSTLGKTEPRTMKPDWDLREIVGIVAKESEDFQMLSYYFSKHFSLTKARECFTEYKLIKNQCVQFEGYEVLCQKVTRTLYDKISGKYDRGEIYWIYAIDFCNLLSKRCGLTPVYSVEGDIDVVSYAKHHPYTGFFSFSFLHDREIKLVEDKTADGFRLPDEDLFARIIKHILSSNGYSDDDITSKLLKTATSSIEIDTTYKAFECLWTEVNYSFDIRLSDQSLVYEYRPGYHPFNSGSDKYMTNPEFRVIRKLK